MRITLLFCVSLLVSTGITPAQQADDLHLRASNALHKMNAQSWELREKGFEELPSLDELSASPQDVDRVKVGIIRLLSSENALIREYKRKGKFFTTEDHSEYYAGLIATVAAMDDERAIPALLGAVSRGGMATRAIARFGDKAVGPLLDLYGTPSEDSLDRSSALFTIQEVLEMQIPISDASQSQIRNALRNAIKDPDYRVRYVAICAIEYLKDREDFVPALKDLAEHDPGENVGKEHHSLRPVTEQLLQKIANHEPPRRRAQYP